MKFLGVIFQLALTDCINFFFAVGDTFSVKIIICGIALSV